MSAILEDSATVSAEMAAMEKTVRRKKSKPHEQVRVAVSLPKPFFKKLEEAQEVTHDVNVGDVMKTAAKFFLALLDEQRKGNDVYVISEDGTRTRYPIFSIE
jgi:hypothetical protein